MNHPPTATNRDNEPTPNSSHRVHRFLFSVQGFMVRGLINPGIVHMCFWCDRAVWFWHKHPVKGTTR